MADKPINPIVNLTPEQCETVLESWLGEHKPCTGVRRLTGGCVNTVLEVTYGGDDSRVVFKVSHEARDDKLECEFNVLKHYRERTTAFPLPEPLHCDISGSELPYSYIVMERLPGDNMGDASMWMSGSDRRHIDHAIGETVADLHTCTRDKFGDALTGGTDQTWPEYFRDTFILKEYRDNEKIGLVSADAMRTIRSIIDRLDTLLDTPGAPTLVHGDIWATNIMIDRGSASGAATGTARLVGYLDPNGRYCHTEFELAYLEIWSTVGRDFFDAYTARHTLLDGYPLRRAIYWLYTFLQHVRAFKTRNYAQAAEQLAAQLKAVVG
jgi:fructosamine-3-kinase